MKKIVGIVLFLSFALSGRTQIVVALLFGDKLNTGKLEFGLVVSPAITSITNIESDPRFGFNLGIYLNIRPDKRWFLHVEGIGKGAFGARGISPYPTGNDSLDNLLATGSVERKIQVFSMPVLLRYRISKLFFAEGGIQPNLMLKTKDIFTNEVNGSELNYTVKITDQLNRLDFGVAGGLFYKFSDHRQSMGIGLRYFYGLTDTHRFVKGTQANTAWVINVTIPVGTGKSQAPKSN
ncbi:MAG: PorT family protein [Chitinophagaceae bacterium]|nr:PorT family protein [Chitinophagaceae bacterium]